MLWTAGLSKAIYPIMKVTAGGETTWELTGLTGGLTLQSQAPVSEMLERRNVLEVWTPQQPWPAYLAEVSLCLCSANMYLLSSY